MGGGGVPGDLGRTIYEAVDIEECHSTKFVDPKITRPLEETEKHTEPPGPNTINRRKKASPMSSVNEFHSLASYAQ
jgi:hypothetical protein